MKQSMVLLQAAVAKDTNMYFVTYQALLDNEFIMMGLPRSAFCRCHCHTPTRVLASQSDKRDLFKAIMQQ
jgi:hypothetical protein